MGIRVLKSFLVLMFLFHSINTKAQERKELLQLISTTENIADNKISDNGEWSAWRKSYDEVVDTLMIRSKNSEEAKLRTQVIGYRFLKGNTMLISYKDKAEWIQLDKGKSHFIENLSRAFPINSGKYFGVIQKSNKENIISIYNSENGTKMIVEDFDQYFYYANEEKLLITKKKGEINEIKFWDNNHFENLKSTSDNVVLVKLSSDNSSWVLIGKSKDEKLFAELFDRKCSITWKVKSPLNQDIQTILPLPQIDGQWLFEFITKPKERGDGIVEVWYSNEKKLETFYRATSKIISLLVNPDTGKQHNLSDFGYEDIFPISGNRAIAYHKSELKDYITDGRAIKLHLIDINSGNNKFIDTVDYALLNKSANLLLFRSNNVWKLHNLKSDKKTIIDHQNLSSPVFVDDNTVLFVTEGAIWRYDLHKQIGRDLIANNNYVFKILSKNSEIKGTGFIRLELSEHQARTTILFEGIKKDRSDTSIWKFSSNKAIRILDVIGNNYRSLKFSDNMNKIQWIEENHNVSPALKIKNVSGNSKVLYTSNTKNHNFQNLKKEIITYKNSRGKWLNGVLYYPANFSEKRKYPLVLKIYEDQLRYANDFVTPSLKNGVGFNLMNLVQEGYFVLLPDIVYDDRGPGVCAVDAVHAVLDEVSKIPSVDSSNAALFGFSFGGYETNFIATQSNRFKTFISGGGKSDTVSDYFLYNNHFNILNYYRFENFQMRHKESFTDNKEKYFTNNPIYFTENVKVPMLVFTGKKDENVPWNNTIKMYSALRRNNKKVIALFYKEEGHGLTQKAGQEDLTFKILDWLDYFLKNKKVDWIDKEMKDAI